jgi:L-alanine-DL-glutamate epimerase-like enolase superfamily enzyme
MRVGGVTGWMRAAVIAGAAGIPMSTHLYPEVAAHVMRVTETAHWLEWQDWVDPILQQPYTIKDGHLHIPDVQALVLNGTRMRLRHTRFRQRPMSVHGPKRTSACGLMMSVIGGRADMPRGLVEVRF